MSQLYRVLARLRRGPLTSAQALAELGVGRLGARVYELRSVGYDIHTETMDVINRFGDQCRVARYKLRRGLR